MFNLYKQVFHDPYTNLTRFLHIPYTGLTQAFHGPYTGLSRSFQSSYITFHILSQSYTNVKIKYCHRMLLEAAQDVHFVYASLSREKRVLTKSHNIAMYCHNKSLLALVKFLSFLGTCNFSSTLKLCNFFSRRFG